jgi:protein-S-isoprenylcysteine O-methyltransferase Ste14
MSTATSAPARFFLALRSAVWAAAFALLWGWLVAAVRPFDDRMPFAVPDWARPLGVAVGFAGVLLTLWCVITFATRGRGTPAPFDPPREFVAAGPYRYVRNPMYIGGFGVLLGAGLILRSPAIVALSALFLLVFHLFVLVYEEPSLAHRFGDSYRDYKATVRRWLPRITPRSDTSS